MYQFSHSVTSDSLTPWTEALQASLSITNSQSCLKLMPIKSVMPSNHLILCRPLLLLPSIFPSNRVFSNKSVLRIRWLKYWNFSFSISPSNEYSGLIFFRIDCFDLLAVQGSLKNLLQHHSSKACVYVCVCSPSPSQRDSAYISSDPQSNSIKSEPKNGVPYNSAILLFCFVKLVWPFTEVYPTKLYDWFNVRDRGEWTNSGKLQHFEPSNWEAADTIDR